MKFKFVIAGVKILIANNKEETQWTLTIKDNAEGKFKNKLIEKMHTETSGEAFRQALIFLDKRK